MGHPRARLIRRTTVLDDSIIRVPVWFALVDWSDGNLPLSCDTHVGDGALQTVYCFAWRFGFAVSCVDSFRKLTETVVCVCYLVC